MMAENKKETQMKPIVVSLIGTLNRAGFHRESIHPVKSSAVGVVGFFSGRTHMEIFTPRAWCPSDLERKPVTVLAKLSAVTSFARNGSTTLWEALGPFQEVHQTPKVMVPQAIPFPVRPLSSRQLNVLTRGTVLIYCPEEHGEEVNFAVVLFEQKTERGYRVIIVSTSEDSDYTYPGQSCDVQEGDLWAA